MEIPLRGLVLRKPRGRGQIEHEIEPLGARLVLALEIDRADRAARRHTRAMRFAAVEIDLVGLVDRVFRTRAEARVAARAKVEVDRVLLRPCRLELAEPAVERGELSGV